MGIWTSSPPTVGGTPSRSSSETAGSFSLPSVVKLEPGYNNYSFALGDIDGDGHLDLVAASSDPDVEPGRMSTMRGDGKGGFKDDHGSRLTCHRACVGALADLNGDRRPDIVLNHGAELSVLLNQGDGQFAPATGSPLPLGMRAYAVVVADINRDEHADLVVPTVDTSRPTDQESPAARRRSRVHARTRLAVPCRTGPTTLPWGTSTRMGSSTWPHRVSRGMA